MGCVRQAELQLGDVTLLSLCVSSPQHVGLMCTYLFLFLLIQTYKSERYKLQQDKRFFQLYSSSEAKLALEMCLMTMS